MFGLAKKQDAGPQIQQEDLDVLGLTIAAKRDEAVKARKESGIEGIWMKCEESYLGIDDANRHEFGQARWMKSRAIDGPISTNAAQPDETRSTAFVRLTSRYVDFASAKLSEIALPIDDKAFSFSPTPVPDLVAQLQNGEPVFDEQGQPVMMPAPDAQQQASQPPTAQPPDQLGMPVAGGQPAQVQMTKGDQAKQLMDQANDAADKAERRIYDWMVEGKYPSEMRKVIFDAARIGTGILKGPVPTKRKSQAVVQQGNVIALEIEEKIAPTTDWVDPWNFFPAPNCGEDIHDGDYVFERDYISPKGLRKLMGRSGWIDSQIEKVLEEGPGKAFTDSSLSQEEKAKKNRFERWQYYGVLTQKEIDSTGYQVPTGAQAQNNGYFYAILTLVNDTVIRCVLNPLDSGDFPYHVFNWSRRAGYWAGVGASEQLDMPQRMCNASTRALLENAGISAGVQIIMARGKVTPADGKTTLTRNKLWYVNDDAFVENVNNAFNIIEIPNLTQQLMPIIEYSMKLAEEHTSIPLVSMGQYAENASPQTFGQAQLQNSNANSLLRDKGRALDDAITEPLVNSFYEWLLLDPDVPAEEKGDFQINAHGTITFVEQAIQEWTLAQMVQLALNPAFGKDPEKVFDMYLKSKKLNPSDMEMDDAKKQQMAQAQSSSPQVQVAHINAASREKIAGIQDETAQQKNQADAQQASQELQVRQNEGMSDRQLKVQELQMTRDIAILQYATQQKISLQDAKVQLANTALKLKVTKELAAADAAAKDLPMQPPVEPPGRAQSGHSFEQ